MISRNLKNREKGITFIYSRVTPASQALLQSKKNPNFNKLLVCGGSK